MLREVKHSAQIRITQLISGGSRAPVDALNHQASLYYPPPYPQLLTRCWPVADSQTCLPTDEMNEDYLNPKARHSRLLWEFGKIASSP